MKLRLQAVHFLSHMIAPCNTTPVQKELKMYNPSIIKVKNQNSYIIEIITHNYLPNQDVSYGDLVMNVKPRGSLC